MGVVDQALLEPLAAEGFILVVPGLGDPVRAEGQDKSRRVERGMMLAERDVRVDAEDRPVAFQVKDRPDPGVHEQGGLVAAADPRHGILADREQEEGHQPLEVAQVGFQVSVQI